MGLQIRCQFPQHFTSRFFCKKVFWAAFFNLQFGFIIFWQKNIGTKVAHKMLMKSTGGVNFINILRNANISKVFSNYG